MDWDRDGVVDTRQDHSSFDKNGNGIADWLEEGTDQNWVYNGNTGWDDVETLKPNQVYGPSAEDIRKFVDYQASMSIEATNDLYNPWGIPNYKAFDFIANTVAKRMSDLDYSSSLGAGKKNVDKPVMIASANTGMDHLYKLFNNNDKFQTDVGKYDFLFPHLNLLKKDNNSKSNKVKWEGYTTIHADTYFEYLEEEAKRVEEENKAKAGTVYALASTDKTRLTDAQQKANAQYIYDYLSKEGWTKEAISGLLGNIQQESHLNPGVWQGFQNKKQGYGLVQWTGATKFFNWANFDKDKAEAEADFMATNDPRQLMELQLEFLIWSSKSTTPSSDREWYGTTKHDSPYKMTYAQFIVSTKDVGELALVFHGSYERSADDEKRKQLRIDYAEKWYKYFSE